MNYKEVSLRLHEEKKGKIEVVSKVPVETRDDLSVAYTPGVGEVSRHIAGDKELVYRYTAKGNMVAVITDGSAVLGLGNIGPEAALPVMEGKALLFKEFADVDAFPICLATQDADEIVETVRRIAPGFGGVNLEDISAPRCFEVEDRLQDLGIPVFHDDQHGTAIVLLAALINAAKVVGKDMAELSVVINGAGAAGIAIANLLSCYNDDTGLCVPVADVIVVDSKGIIVASREDLSPIKQNLAQRTNKHHAEGDLKRALEGADVFIGVSVAGALTEKMIQGMASDPIVFAMANPDPEIMPDQAKHAGAKVVATGRSDFPNQINNVLAFPGIFRGALDVRATRITQNMKIAAAYALSKIVKNPSEEEILPPALDKRVAPTVATAVSEAWLRQQ